MNLTHIVQDTVWTWPGHLHALVPVYLHFFLLSETIEERVRPTVLSKSGHISIFHPKSVGAQDTTACFDNFPIMAELPTGVMTSVPFLQSRVVYKSYPTAIARDHFTRALDPPCQSIRRVYCLLLFFFWFWQPTVRFTTKSMASSQGPHVRVMKLF